jgi:hypothetical protein
MTTRIKSLDSLATASIVFLAANVLHTFDHFRQGTGDLSTEILVAGSLLTLSAVATLVLVLRRHPQAPLVAAVVGFSGAAGILASHVAPHWSALSDSYPEINADAISWVVMLIEFGAALALGLAALRELRHVAPRVPAEAR